MNKSEIKIIIDDQKDEKEKIVTTEKIIKREQMGPWQKFVQNNLIKVTMGVRRSGKTVFTHLLLKKHPYAYVNFDDERLAFVESDDLNNVLESLYEIYGDFEYLLLDEVQNVPGWELFVNRLQRNKIKVFVTGSNANLLSKELSTHLTGRFIEMEILPFSFREFLLYHGIDEIKTTTRERARLKKNLEDYIEHGGFPEVVKTPEIQNTYLASLYSSIITRDIISRYNIRFIKTFREMATTLISNFSHTITFNRLKNVHEFKSIHTAKNYVEYLSDAYLIYILEKFSSKPREIANSPKKLYIIDTGLINTLSVSASKNKGDLLENLVFLQLERKRALDPNMEVYYWRDYQGREIDFVIRIGKSVDTLIQVTYASDKNEIDSREIKSLLKGADLLKCKNLMVITWDYEDEEVIDSKKILYTPAWKWLLGLD
jgi:predicted AAA+ superfamily ATPase